MYAFSGPDHKFMHLQLMGFTVERMDSFSPTDNIGLLSERDVLLCCSVHNHNSLLSFHLLVSIDRKKKYDEPFIFCKIQQQFYTYQLQAIAFVTPGVYFTIALIDVEYRLSLTFNEASIME